MADYATIVPASTRTPSASAISAISGKPGAIQTLTVRRAIAIHYRRGDVIAAGRSRHTPNGLIVRIARIVKRGPGAISFRVSSATLAQALPRTIIDARVPAPSSGPAIRLACGSTATAAVTAELDMGLGVHLATGGRKPHLTAASFELKPTARTGVTVSTSADGTCNVARSRASSPSRVTVYAGPVPIVLVPRISTRVAVAGSYGPGINATTLQTITGTLRLSYDGTSWRRSSHLVRTTSHRLDDGQPAPAAARMLSTKITPMASILLDGLSGPHLDLSDAPSLAFTPTASLDLAHTTSATDGLEATARPLTDRKSPRDAAIFRATEPLDHRTLFESSPGGPGASATRVVAGGGMTCALPASGRLYCWGIGALGNGTMQSSRPVLVPGLTDVRQVSTRGADTCVVLASGAVDCWGAAVLRPTAVQGITTAVQLATSAGHTCAALAGGTVKCWGVGSDGELGNGKMGSTADSPVPVAVTGITTATQISTGGEHSCALLADGTVTCWGHNSGPRDPVTGLTADSAVPVPVAGVAHAIQVSAGTAHDCALLSNAVVLCWGAGFDGELGNGQQPNASGPVAALLAAPAAQVSAGDRQTCALLKDGTISCWGVGVLADVTDGVSSVPVTVPAIATAIGVSAGGVPSCAVLRDGAVDCWGDDSYGEPTGSPDVSIDFGNGTTTYATTARTVTFAAVSQISAGGDQRCAVLQSGATDCWGLNDQLALGLPATTQSAPAPTGVPALASDIATQISAGKSVFPREDHTCARLQAGTVACWGADDAGQLGNGTTPAFSGPVLVSGITTAVQVAAGGEHSCAVLQNGTVACWGANDSGQLGNGTTSPSATPVLVSGITTATHVTAGESHSCALLQDGSVECWGDDFYGELGNGHAGNSQSSSVPVAAEIFPTNPATEISAGGYNTCAVMQNRTVTCWGNGDHGQLGNGGVFPHDSSPVLVANINNATDVSTGLDYACAVRVDGGVSCWGSDLNAQLGSTTHITSFDVSTPVDVLGVAGATHVSAGSSATCATLANGTAACWGSGLLGDAPSDSPLAPTTVTGLPDS